MVFIYLLCIVSLGFVVVSIGFIIFIGFIIIIIIIIRFIQMLLELMFVFPKRHTYSREFVVAVSSILFHSLHDVRV